MKKWMKICLIVVCVLLVFELFAWIFGYRISPFFVDKAVLCSYDSENDKYYTAEVTDGEMWKLVLLYNYGSFHKGSLIADAPPMSDSLEFRLTNGASVTIDELRSKNMLIKPGYYKFVNSWLYDYIQALLEKYDLPVW